MSAFDDLGEFAALPRLTALTLSGDGRRLVATVQHPDAKNARYISALWELDLTGEAAHRLTHSQQGETGAAFLADGRLAFTSSRARPDTDGAADDAAVWALPAAGEPELLLRRPGGLSGAVVASGSGHLVLGGSRLTWSSDADDAARRTVRKDRNISAILHSAMPIRYWDHELDVESSRLLVLDPGATELRDLAPDAAIELTEASFSISADGTRVATTWMTRAPGGRAPGSIVLIDVASGDRRVLLASDDDTDYSGPKISPDGSTVAAQRYVEARFDRPWHEELVFASRGP